MYLGLEVILVDLLERAGHALHMVSDLLKQLLHGLDMSLQHDLLALVVRVAIAEHSDVLGLLGLGAELLVTCTIIPRTS